MRSRSVVIPSSGSDSEVFESPMPSPMVGQASPALSAGALDDVSGKHRRFGLAGLASGPVQRTHAIWAVLLAGIVAFSVGKYLGLQQNVCLPAVVAPPAICPPALEENPSAISAVSGQSSGGTGKDESREAEFAGNAAESAKSEESAADSAKKLKKFVYIYEMGGAYTDKVYELGKPSWYSVQYDAEKVLAQLLSDSDVYRTRDPSEASLFFVPFYAARFTLFHFKDSKVNMREAVQKTSEQWEEILRWVRTNYPYFNRTRGRDHFGILTMDHGRCTALTFLPPEMYGDMFFLQLNGDKVVRSIHSNARNMQSISYNYGRTPNISLPDIPCFMTDRDIVIPPMAKLPTELPSPDRPIKVLFRFSQGQHHGVPISHHGHEIRKELFQLFKGKGIKGFDFEVKSEYATRDDWKKAIFCACPPGHSQWTSRPMKSILSGCIPITFFREHSNPWEDLIDYSAFSINVDPDELATLPARVNEVLENREKLEEMQRQVTKVQDFFRWSGELESGVEGMVMRTLKNRAIKLNRSLRKGRGG